MLTLLKRIKGIGLTLLLPLVLYLAFYVSAPSNFGSAAVLRTILTQSLIPMICGFGMLFGRSMGILDLSIGSRIIASSMFAALLTERFGLGIAGLFVLTVLFSVLLGAVVGAVYCLCKIPSVVVALVVAMFFEVIGFKITDGAAFLQVDPELCVLGRTPWNLIVAALSLVAFALIYSKTKFCYNVRAISGDELIAKGNGINVDRTKFLAYTIGSIFVGIAAVIQISYASSMSAKQNMESLSMSFDPLMAMVIGIQIQDYVTLPVGIFIGAFMISTLFSGLVALGMSATAQDIATGLFLIVVIAISTNSGRIQTAIRKRRAKAAY